MTARGPFVVAIDGPAASGKGTLARRLARHLGLPHLDTGLLYRAVAQRLLETGAPLGDPSAAAAAARALRPESLDETRLRGARMGEAASVVSAHAPVRDALIAVQRGFASQPGGAVLDGRDIGTVICPEARLKLFVTASPEERARRRLRELRAAGEPVAFDAVLDEIRRRDERDETRPAAPLRRAPGAILLDTTALDADAVFGEALRLVERFRT